MNQKHLEQTNFVSISDEEENEMTQKEMERLNALWKQMKNSKKNLNFSSASLQIQNQNNKQMQNNSEFRNKTYTSDKNLIYNNNTNNNNNQANQNLNVSNLLEQKEQRSFIQDTSPNKQSSKITKKKQQYSLPILTNNNNDDEQNEQQNEQFRNNNNLNNGSDNYYSQQINTSHQQQKLYIQQQENLQQQNQEDLMHKCSTESCFFTNLQSQQKSCHKKKEIAEDTFSNVKLNDDQPFNRTVTIQNHNLEKKITENEQELDQCHAKIAKLVIINNQQNLQITEMAEKLDQFTQHQKNIVENQKINANLLEQDIKERENQIEEQNKYIADLQEQLAQKDQLISDQEQNLIHHQQIIEQKNNENQRLNNRLQQVEQSIDELYYQKMGNNETEIDNMKSDLERMVQLLKNTKEFKEFSLYCEDSKDIRFLKRVHTTYKGNIKDKISSQRKNSSCCGQQQQNQIDKTVKEQFFWVPKDAFLFLTHFTQKNNGQITQDKIEEIIFGFNKFYQQKEDKKIERISKKYEIQIEKLKKELDKNTPLDEVLAKRKVLRLKQQLNKSITQTNNISNQNTSNIYSNNNKTSMDIIDTSQIFVCDRSQTPGANNIRKGSTVNSSFLNVSQILGGQQQNMNDSNLKQSNPNLKIFHYNEVVKLTTEYEAGLRKKDEQINYLKQEIQNKNNHASLKNLQDQCNSDYDKLIYMEGAI